MNLGYSDSLSKPNFQFCASATRPLVSYARGLRVQSRSGSVPPKENPQSPVEPVVAWLLTRGGNLGIKMPFPQGSSKSVSSLARNPDLKGTWRLKDLDLSRAPCEEMHLFLIVPPAPPGAVHSFLWSNKAFVRLLSRCPNTVYNFHGLFHLPFSSSLRAL